MTYEQDPTRWSDSASTDVPDVLRDLMQAGAQEAPSAAKLAALGSKVSAAATATGAATTTAGAVGATKLWLAGLAIGAAVLGGTGYLVTNATVNEGVAAPRQQASAAARSERDMSPSLAPRSAGDAARSAAPAPTSAPEAMAATPSAPEIASNEPQEVAAAELPQAQPTVPPAAPERSLADRREQPKPIRESRSVEPRVADAEREEQPEAARSAQPRQPEAQQKRQAKAVSGRSADRARSGRAPETRERRGSGPNELQLLQHARRALSLSPRRALELAHQHATRFPDSQFAQERAVVVIEALTRSGQLERAREEARQFIDRYPSSAHAHRFRERLGL